MSNVSGAHAISEGTTTRRWIPYADGELEQAARGSIDRILSALATNSSHIPPSISLWEGRAGVSLALFSLSKDRGTGILAAADAMWDRTVQGLHETVVDSGLFTGFCGVGWVDAFLEDDPSSQDDTHEDLERTLLVHLERRDRGQALGYDLISGLVGIGLYALERRPRGYSEQVLATVVDQVVQLAVEHKNGFTWIDPPAGRERRQNLGLAHGVPGVVSFLARVEKAGFLSRHGQAVLEGAVECLLGARREMAHGLRYSYGLNTETDAAEGKTSRVAWCYGDLGVAAALLMAGECHGVPRWSQEARELALNCSRLPFQNSGVQDHGLCHGTSGIAHTLARMSAVLGCDDLRSGAQRWLRRTFETRMHGVGIDGYVRVRPRNPLGTSLEERDYYPSTDPGFLMGASGVALALTASFSTDNPGWDRVLLLSD